MSTLRQAAFTLFLALLATSVAMAVDTPQIFHVPEDKIEFQLYPEPALAFVGINSSSQPIEGNFSFEIVDIIEKNKRYEDSVFASSRGTFKRRAGRKLGEACVASKEPTVDRIGHPGIHEIAIQFHPEGRLRFRTGPWGSATWQNFP